MNDNYGFILEFVSHYCIKIGRLILTIGTEKVIEEQTS